VNGFEFGMSAMDYEEQLQMSQFQQFMDYDEKPGKDDKSKINKVFNKKK